jgi:hypothetical protein
MSTTVTGSPPRGQATPRRHAAPGQQQARASRWRLRLPRASTTPGRLWLVRAGLVVLCLAWGVLATLTISQRASAALIWLVVAPAGARADLLKATGHGSGPAQTLAEADITVLQARGDETLNLISRSGDANFQQDFHTAQSKLSSLLNSASANSAADGAAPIAAAGHAATAWFAVNQQAQKLDAVYDYGAETQLEIGSGPGTAGTLFGQLETNINVAISADQSVFAASAADGADALTGLEAGIAVLALVMVVGCAWGITRRLAEYR